jgi:hypothetical protein
MKDRLKKVIFDKLYMNLGKAELIEYNNHIWLIDREKKYWYFEYEKSGMLWWRFQFFEDFFILFSMEKKEYEPFIVSWVEDVLNCKVSSMVPESSSYSNTVEDVLNCKVSSTDSSFDRETFTIDEVLRISESNECCYHNDGRIEGILKNR